MSTPVTQIQANAGQPLPEAPQPNASPNPDPTATAPDAVPRGISTPAVPAGDPQAKLGKMNSDADAALKKFAALAGIEFRQPASHFDRVRLAHDIAIALRTKDPAQYEAFLGEMEAAGKPLGVNFGLSRGQGADRTSLNQQEYDALDGTHRTINHQLRQDRPTNPSTVQPDAQSTTAPAVNPTPPQASPTTTPTTPTTQPDTQARQQIAGAVAALDRDGDRNTLSLDEVRHAMRQGDVGDAMLALYRDLEQHMVAARGGRNMTIDELVEWSAQRATRQAPQQLPQQLPQQPTVPRDLA